MRVKHIVGTYSWMQTTRLTELIKTSELKRIETKLNSTHHETFSLFLGKQHNNQIKAKQIHLYNSITKVLYPYIYQPNLQLNIAKVL